jgi:hypothetical protein
MFKIYEPAEPTLNLADEFLFYNDSQTFQPNRSSDDWRHLHGNNRFADFSDRRAR